VPHFELLVRGGRVVTPEGVARADVGVRDGRVAAVAGLADASADEVLDARGACVLPGGVDPQVHLREPGLEHKEDLATGTRAAVLGGITTVLDMPNTLPPTTDADALADKRRRASGRVWCDVGFFVGATPENAEALAELETLPGCVGVKIFMGKSTGDLLVDTDADLRRVLASGRGRVAVHAEDETRLRERRQALDLRGGGVALHPAWRDVESAVRATRRLLAAAREAGRPVHVLHVTTAEELELLAGHRDVATAETTPQHLTLAAPECYRELGTRCQMNPPLREARHREALWRGLERGVLDCLATDHAPHTLEEKARPYPESPAGMPGLQTLLPVMLDHVAAGRLPLPALARLCAAAPARIWGLADKGRIVPGADADLAVVDPEGVHELRDADMASRCGWTPFHGRRVRGRVVATVLRGRVVAREGEILGAPSGRVVRVER